MPKQDDGLDAGLLIIGLIIGLLIGAIVILFRVPKNAAEAPPQIHDKDDDLRVNLESAASTNPIAESLAEGKAAARRRRAELGLDN